jgi:two-component system, NarL family, sensor histidine kinase UhpB
MTRRDDSLISQIVAANVVLVASTLFAASLAAGLDLNVRDQRWQFLILALAIVLSLCVNLWMLQRRFRPLERLIDRIEHVDPAEPTSLEVSVPEPIEEIDRLGQSFTRLLDRIEEERLRSGQLVLRAQEEERRRLARDLHDEVNQALTAILLRLEALATGAPPQQVSEVVELKRLVNQAMEELLNLARQLRPTALDDHGLVPAIDAQLKRFAARTGVEARLRTEGDPEQLDEDRKSVIYRVAQEALTNIGRHAGATAVDVELDVDGSGSELRIRDDGAGFDPAEVARTGSRNGSGLGLIGMAERARLAGGELQVLSAPGGGTTVTLRIGARL